VAYHVNLLSFGSGGWKSEVDFIQSAEVEVFSRALLPPGTGGDNAFL
jgi:hypothetical protein